MPCLVFLCVPLMPSLLLAFQAKLPNFQFTVHLYTVYLTLLSGWRRKWLLSYCGALTTRSRGTVFWQPGCAHTKMTLSSPMRTSYSSCQVRSRLFVWFGFQVASDPDPSETLQRYQIAAGTYFSASDGCQFFRVCTRVRGPGQWSCSGQDDRRSQPRWQNYSTQSGSSGTLCAHDYAFAWNISVLMCVTDGCFVGLRSSEGHADKEPGCCSGSGEWSAWGCGGFWVRQTRYLLVE